MSSSISNLEKLTEQIYQEGIEKARMQSAKMIAEAEAEKALLLKKAKAQADGILEEAQREANRLHESVESELQLKSKQFISDLKAKIEGLLSEKIVETTTRAALLDVNFIQAAIIEVLKHWQNPKDLELVLPKSLEDKINTAFSQRIKELAPNMTITFESALNAGFRIARKEDHYQISFSDDDFIEIFKTYLSQQTNQVLFKASS